MKVLFLGDISARPGRDVVIQILPELRKCENIDLVIANGENAAGGRGITKEIINELTNSGIDFFTTGEHIWAQKSLLAELSDTNLPLVRPYNYEASNQIPGKTYEIIDLGPKGRVVVAVFLGQTFMREFVRSPFWQLDELLEKLIAEGIEYPNDTIIIDFHAEATSEKATFAHYVRDRVSAVLGTHTHVATADQRLLGDTAFVTDVGMSGIRNASLWVKYENVIHNNKFPFKKSFEVETEGEKIFNSVLVTLEKGKAVDIVRIDKIIK
jgi:2',3'-cyclic-nucleotide 2'-phosphodiesterase